MGLICWDTNTGMEMDGDQGTYKVRSVQYSCPHHALFQVLPLGHKDEGDALKPKAYAP